MSRAVDDRLGGRSPLLGWAAAVLAVLAILALILSRAAGVGPVAEQARSLSAIDETLAHLEVSYVLVGESLVLSVDREAGLATESAQQGVLDATRQRLGALQASVPEANETEVFAYLNQGFAVLDQLDDGDLSAAKDELEADLPETYGQALTALQNERVRLLGAIDGADSLSGIVATVAGFLVALAIPLGILALYRVVAQRQLRREMESARVRAAEDARRAKDEFLSSISEELRSPLEGITNTAMVLEEGSLFDPVTGLEMVNAITWQAGRLGRMLDDMMSISELDAGTYTLLMGDVDLGDILQQVVPFFERVGGAISVRGRSCVVMADVRALKAILRNILANAVEHGQPPVQIEIQTLDEMAHVAISDAGAGVEDDHAESIFTRFKTRDSEGIGLGLPVARELARRMHGDVRVVSGEGGGVFMIDLVVATGKTGANSNAMAGEADHG